MPAVDPTVGGDGGAIAPRARLVAIAGVVVAGITLVLLVVAASVAAFG